MIPNERICWICSICAPTLVPVTDGARIDPQGATTNRAGLETEHETLFVDDTYPGRHADGRSRAGAGSHSTSFTGSRSGLPGGSASDFANLRELGWRSGLSDAQGWDLDQRTAA